MMGRNQRKKAENTQSQNASPSKDDHSSTSTMEQGLMENERILMTESLFEEWIITNFGELKEHVVAQRKETRNFEKRFDEILLRIDNLERSMSELMELKNTIQELREVCTGLNTRIVQAEGISEVKVQFNEIKCEEKIREKRIKRNDQSLQEMWDYVKRPNLHLIGVPECDGENESKLENTLQDIIQENFPELAKQVDRKVRR
uniref:Uncharacterized protein n=1 Tax=Callithrix jacchus TaxID=9483 RepID=A0A8I4A2H3_CALJA